MNLVQKTRNFIYLLRNDVPLRGALYSFKGPLTDGDKFTILVIALALGIMLVVKHAAWIDGCAVVAK